MRDILETIGTVMLLFLCGPVIVVVVVVFFFRLFLEIPVRNENLLTNCDSGETALLTERQSAACLARSLSKIANKLEVTK